MENTEKHERESVLDKREFALAKREEKVLSDLQAIEAEKAKLTDREKAIIIAEQKRDAGFADERAQVGAELDKREFAVAEHEKKVLADHQAIEVEKAKLTEREKAIIIAEQRRDAGFSDERAALSIELRHKRAQVEAEISNAREEQLSQLEDEVAGLRAHRLAKVSEAENAERERIRAEIAKEREAWAKQQDDTQKQLSAERTEFEKQKGALSALQSEIEGRKIELETDTRTLERKEQRLEQQWQKRNARLDDEVEEQIAERRNSLELVEASSKEENTRLRESLRIQTALVSTFEQLRQQLGGKDPAEILRELNSQTDELKRLRKELATRPTEEMRERNQVLESEANNQKARADELSRQLANNGAALAEVGDLRRKNSELNAENKSLEQKASIFEGAANEAHAELNRLRKAYERPAETEDRYKKIERPHIKTDSIRPPVKADIDEMTWLKGIGNACDSYGLHFNPRILKAFHTALKTAEWSPLTVLAGVSGTGKSELPRLYSHFGGIFFEPLSVQPNWDSQESMLGFFNSIDNEFDAQPVLQFLAQSQKPWSDDYPGLQDSVCLVLLDEMNLAHPELYFAEFLSKLELRRGRRGTDVPFIPVKIGAGLDPYKLPLGRNVIWTGTMNQDETTKSLSDKVIDRSIIINFPRPTELRSRKQLKNLAEIPFVALHRKSWDSWWVKEVKFEKDEITPFREFIEGINAALAVSGRALGHRVWQSIEYYMANYPDVRAAQSSKEKDALSKAMHIAFEDQLVQKVMPKLRGIDTRGKSMTECLYKIRGQLVTGIGGNSFNLAEDFDLACELGYGQFIWQSANYLNTDDVKINDCISVSQNTDEGEEPPALFHKDEKDQIMRRKAWNVKSLEQRNKLRAQLEENAKKGRISA